MTHTYPSSLHPQSPPSYMLARILPSMTAIWFCIQILMVMQCPVMASPLAVQQLSSRTGPPSSGEQSGSHVPTGPTEGDATASALPVLFGYRFLDASWWIVFGGQEVFQYTVKGRDPAGYSKVRVRRAYNQLEGHDRMSFQDFGFKTRDVGRSIDFLSNLPANMPRGAHPVKGAVEALLEAGFVTAASSEDSMKHLKDWLRMEIWQPVEFLFKYPRTWMIVFNKQEGMKYHRQYGCSYFKDGTIISYNGGLDEGLKDFGFEVKVNDRSSWILKNAPFPDLIQDLLKDGLLTGSTEGLKEFRQWYKPYRKVCEASDKIR
ncbi:hypothetical protein EV361DRAFT_928253 [Lentinula raphanica]|nr:hypothetical protein EV361DRAFT_928253 [Lentinula raphanica]